MADRDQQHQSRRTRRERSGAFTLVELLVVIGIIAVLIGVLLPALARARQSANQTKCMANLRSIGQAIYIYAQYNQGSLPFGFVVDGSTTPVNINGGVWASAQTEWTELLLSVLNRQGTDQSQQIKATDSDQRSRGLFICPEVARGSSSADFITHYSAHPRIMPDLQTKDFSKIVGFTLPYIKGRRLASIKNSSDMVILFDGTMNNTTYMAHSVAEGLDSIGINNPPYLTTNMKGATAPRNDPGTPVDMTPEAGTPADFNIDSNNNAGNIRFRHMNNTQANCLLVDGHVQAFKLKKTTDLKNATDLQRRNIYVNPQ
jgi:prepilin-type processing-associated H-X9-DG protein